ncbi:MAG: hypothetical protein ACHQJ6_04795 [Candidatus Berkiellales bacterium]
MGSSFDLSTAITNLSAAFSNIESLIEAMSYVIGVFFVVKGMMMFKVLATQTLSSAQKGDISGPLIHIFVGTILVWLPSSTMTGLETIFNTNTASAASSLVAYQSLSAVQQWQDISNVVLQYTKLVGLIAFIRGWIILSKMSGSGSQPGSVGKGMIHVIGGILLINIVDTFNLLAQTLGYTG